MHPLTHSNLQYSSNREFAGLYESIFSTPTGIMDDLCKKWCKKK